MKHSLLLLDLDGTTLNSKKQVSEKNLQSLLKYKEAGGTVAFSSGRNMGNCTEFAKMLHLEDSWHIGINGNELFNVEKNEYRILNQIPEETYEIISRYIKENNCSACAMLPVGCIFHNNGTGNYRWAFKENGFNKEGEIVGLKDVIKVNIATENDEERKRHTAFAESLGMSVTISSLEWIEIMSKGMDKFTGAEELCRLLNKDVCEIAAIGDYENDYALLSKCDLSFCPSNSSDHIKQTVHIVLDKSNDEDAVSYMIENYLLKEN